MNMHYKYPRPPGIKGGETGYHGITAFKGLIRGYYPTHSKAGVHSTYTGYKMKYKCSPAQFVSTGITSNKATVF